MAALRKSLPAGAPDSTSVAAPRSGSHFSLLLGGMRRKRAVWAGLIIVALCAALVIGLYTFTEFDLKKFYQWIDGLNAWMVVPLMAVLPVIGFPVAAVYLVAGARFGPWVGGLVVTLATILHLVLTFGIANSVLRRPLQNFLARRNFHLPEIPADEQAAVALVAALAPGLPYIVRNYLLALAGIRLRTLLTVCVPVYVLRSYVTILLGDLGAELSARRVVILLSVDSLKIVICAAVIWWLKRHHRKYHADDRAAVRSAPSGAGR